MSIMPKLPSVYADSVQVMYGWNGRIPTGSKASPTRGSSFGRSVENLSLAGQWSRLSPRSFFLILALMSLRNLDLLICDVFVC